jgi:hypothetical protein
MGGLRKVPLYLGLSVFVLTVLVSVVKVGENMSFSSQVIKATSSAATVSMTFSRPDLVGVSVSADKPFSGADIIINFDPSVLTILPSTLKGINNFTTSGGTLDSRAGTFSFAVIGSNASAKSAIVATFNVKFQNSINSTDTVMSFIEGSDKTLVLDQQSGLPVSVKTQSLEIPLK